MNARSSFSGNGSVAPAGWSAAPRSVLTLGGAAPDGRQRPGLPRNELPVHDARQLTGAAGQAQIVLDGQVYALRITRAGKLILTK